MPMVIGHEAVGVVEEVGADVTDLAAGDHVVTVFVPSCGHCAPCSHERPALCEPGLKANVAGTLLSGARRFRDGRINHHLGVSGFADYAVVARESCVRIDRSLPFDIAAIFGCAVITGVGPCLNTLRVGQGDSVAVVGLGGVGLAALLGARRAGASPLIAIDVSDSKLAIARDGRRHPHLQRGPTRVRCAGPQRPARRRESCPGNGRLHQRAGARLGHHGPRRHAP